MLKKLDARKLNNFRLISKLSEEDFDSAVELQRQLKKEHAKDVLFVGSVIICIMLIISCLLSSNLVLALILASSLVVLFVLHNKQMPLEVDIYFGLPGAGKTTLAACKSAKYLKKGFDVYSNVPISGTKILEHDDLGKYQIENSLVIIDEASIEYNNRKYLETSPEMMSWLRLHRHYRCHVIVFSQSYNDMEITFRRLAYRFYFVKKSIIPGVICCIPIRRTIGINDMTKEICDEYKMDPFIFRLFTTKRIIGRKYWKMFDSYDAPELPQKEWKTWGNEDNTPTETVESSWFYE